MPNGRRPRPRKIQALGRKAHFATADVGDYDQATGLIAGTIGAFGKIDILVNNAGTSKSAPFLEITKKAGWRS